MSVDVACRDQSVASAAPAAPAAEKLWGGRFASGMAPEMEPLNLSLSVDQRLWRQDLRGSVAWARALHGAAC